jgi:RNA polymerase sigma-70 factor (ECF subfamily)
VRLISESSSKRDDYTIFHTIATEDKNVQEEWCSGELENQMVELIEHLPQTQRDILKMRLYKEMSFKDIAELENISINTALGRMRYALINLRKMIEKHQLITDF